MVSMKQLHALHHPIVLVQLVEQHVPLDSGNQLHVLQHKIVYVRLARYVHLVITKTLRALPLLIDVAQHVRAFPGNTAVEDRQLALSAL